MAPRAKTLAIDEAQVTRAPTAIASAIDRLAAGDPVAQTEPAGHGAFGFFVDHRVA
jgi:hypothetical protein